jgi:hypothetical protein
LKWHLCHFVDNADNSGVETGPARGEAGRRGIHYTSQTPALANRRRKSLRKKLLLLCIGTAKAKYDKISKKFFIKMGIISTGACKTWLGMRIRSNKIENVTSPL